MKKLFDLSRLIKSRMHKNMKDKNRFMKLSKEDKRKLDAFTKEIMNSPNVDIGFLKLRRKIRKRFGNQW